MEDVEKAFCDLFDKAQKVSHISHTDDTITVDKEVLFDLWSAIGAHQKLRYELKYKAKNQTK